MPGPVPGTSFGTFVLEIATVARACQSREFCAQPLACPTQRQTTPESAFGAD
jgi:hypothetical protein